MTLKTVGHPRRPKSESHACKNQTRTRFSKFCLVSRTNIQGVPDVPGALCFRVLVNAKR